MADNAEMVRELYEAMDRHDGASMAAMYDPEGRFRDPVFGELSGAEAQDMWRMLTGRAEDLAVELVEYSSEGDRGSARWIARYTFTRTGRPVTNYVRAQFRFRDGRIVEHIDSFPFWRWARQALGPAGVVLGLPPFNRLIRRRARRDLSEFRD